MLQHMVDAEQQQKFFNQVIIGPLFLKIHMSLLNVVTGAKEQETSLKSIKCHLPTSWRLNFLMYGG